VLALVPYSASTGISAKLYMALWHHGATAFFGTLVPQAVPPPTPFWSYPEQCWLFVSPVLIVA